MTMISASDLDPFPTVTRSFPGGLSNVAEELNAKFSGRVLQSVEPVKKTEPKRPENVITYAGLLELDPCENVETFKELFGDSVEITVELAKEYADKFDWGWAANALLPREVSRLYDKAMKVVREQLRAAHTVENYRYRYTPSGAPRKRFTEKQKSRHLENLARMDVWYREKMATTFARLYVNRTRAAKPTKTEKLLSEFGSKVEALMKSIRDMNDKEQFKEDWELNDALNARLNSVRYRIN